MIQLHDDERDYDDGLDGGVDYDARVVTMMTERYACRWNEVAR